MGSFLIFAREGGTPQECPPSRYIFIIYSSKYLTHSGDFGNALLMLISENRGGVRKFKLTKFFVREEEEGAPFISIV